MNEDVAASPPIFLFRCTQENASCITYEKEEKSMSALEIGYLLNWPDVFREAACVQWG